MLNCVAYCFSCPLNPLPFHLNCSLDSPPHSGPFCSSFPPPSKSSPLSSGPPRSPFGFTPSPSSSPLPLPTFLPTPTIFASHYEPAPSCLFTETERSQELHKVTYEKIIDCVIEHLCNAIIVKYLKTGDAPGITVAHIFHIDPNSFNHP
ncbi:hypothetical protein HD554DRAFT_2178491 [Boletus coccyginus]|nr:hypothetical protein HD554DRAFT_2178491 [Boletus coccyginus]